MCNPLKNMHILPCKGSVFSDITPVQQNRLVPFSFSSRLLATLILLYVKCIKYRTYNNTYTPTSADTLADGGRKAKKNKTTQ